MKNRPAAFEELVNAIARFPSIGRKSAARIGIWLLKQPRERVEEIADALVKARTSLGPCKKCFLYCEAGECGVCGDSSRDRSLLCVVAETEDAWRIESTGEYRGLYHVLGGLLSPLDGVGVEDLTIGALLARVGAAEGGIREVILATDFDTEGNATAAYIGDVLTRRNTRVTRLAYGLPVGAELSYSDDATLAHALHGRRQISGSGIRTDD